MSEPAGGTPDLLRFQRAFEHTPIGMALVAPDGRLLEINRALCEWVGRSREELLGVDFAGITHPDDLQADLDQTGRLARGEIPSYQLEKRYVGEDGRLVWGLLSRSAVRADDGAVAYFITQIQDITALKRAEEALALREAEFRAMVEAWPDVVSRFDREGRHIYVSPSVTAATGRSVDEFLGRTNRELGMPEALLDRWEALIADVFATGEPRSDEFAFDGPTRRQWFESRLQPVRGMDGAIASVLSVARDVTERKTADEAVRRSQELLKQILEILPVGVWIANGAGEIVAGNPAGRRIWAGARYVGLEHYGEYRGWRYHTEEPIAPEEWALARAVTRGETTIGEIVKIQCFDETFKIILNSAVPLSGPDGEPDGAIVVNEDITQLEAAIAALRVLHGILPICAYCKRIRDDKQYWHPVESYISRRTDAVFSHGICPDCYTSEVLPELEGIRASRVKSPKGRVPPEGS